MDEARIGVWDTSFAGGHAIVLGATDQHLKAVAAQVPTVDACTCPGAFVERVSPTPLLMIVARRNQVAPPILP